MFLALSEDVPRNVVGNTFCTSNILNQNLPQLLLSAFQTCRGISDEALFFIPKATAVLGRSVLHLAGGKSGYDYKLSIATTYSLLGGKGRLPVVTAVPALSSREVTTS